MLNRALGLVVSSVAVVGLTFGCGGNPTPKVGAEAGSKLIAEASSGSVSSRVKYERSATGTRFEIAYAGGAPRERLSVSINGRYAAGLGLDPAGSAQVAYSSPANGGDQQLPRAFSQVEPGDVVAVGMLQSQFRLAEQNSNDDGGDDNANDNGSNDDGDDDNANDNESNDEDNDDIEDSGNDNGSDEDGMDDDNGEDSDESLSYELKARMSEGSLRVKVSLEVEEEGSKVEIEVSGGEPGASLDVTIGGSLVGTIELDAEGEGHAEFSDQPEEGESEESPLPDGFVPPVEGDSVTVGPLSGTLTLDDESQSGDDSDDVDASDDDSGEDSHDDAHEDQDEHEEEDD